MTPLGVDLTIFCVFHIVWGVFGACSGYLGGALALQTPIFTCRK